MVDQGTSIHRVLIVGDDRYEWYAPAWCRALAQLGMDVVHFGYGSMWSHGLMGQLERRFMLGPALLEINRRALECAGAFEPEVVLLYAALPLRPTTVRSLASRYWVTTYHNDDPFGALGRKAYSRLFRASLHYAHSHHVYRQANAQDYERAGISRVAVLRSYYLPWRDRPPRLSRSGKARFGHDVVFIGHGEEDERVAYIRALMDARIPLRIFGPCKRWRRCLPRDLLARLSPIRAVCGPDYGKVLAASKICLSFFSRANRDQYTRRVFEIPAVGGFMMCERTPVMQTLYQEDKEAVYFSSTDELVDKCRFYLDHDQTRQRIARAGQRRCVSSGYDIVSRMRQWLADTARWRDEATTGNALPGPK